MVSQEYVLNSHFKWACQRAITSPTLDLIAQLQELMDAGQRTYVLETEQTAHNLIRILPGVQAVNWIEPSR